MSKEKQHRQAGACNADAVEETGADNKAGTTDGAGDKARSVKDDGKNGDAADETATIRNMKAEGSGQEGQSGGAGDAANNLDDLKRELEEIKGKLEEKTKLSAEYLEKLQRTAADFDNYRKRAIKEKEALYTEAVGDVVANFIPIIDNMERALQAVNSDNSTQTLREGVEMIFKQFGETLRKIGVEEIKSLNEQFDPAYHNAVMHVDDEAFGPNTVVEEFQKGYIYKGKVIRHSMVKVAN